MTEAQDPKTAYQKIAIISILAISAVATIFLFWLIYLHPATDAGNVQFSFLPALNAVLNGLSAIALLIGYICIRGRDVIAHRASMVAAFLFSSLFLVGYILHHALHGDVRYPLHAPLRTLYLFLLASHVLLATVALPLILITFFFALTRRIDQHRGIARWTFPLWLYVSVTGVLTFVMLRLA